MKRLLISLAISSSLYAYSGYYAPYKAGTMQYISQGYLGTASHYGAGGPYAIDIAGSFNIYAVKDGVIDAIGTDNYIPKYCKDHPQYWHGPAKYIRIKNSDGIYSYYFHLSSFNKDLKKGQHITQGKFLGITGNTGCSTSTHLHLQFSKASNMKRVNSLKISFEDIGEPRTGDNKVSQNIPETAIWTDGAGSLVRPDLLNKENCLWGCYKDVAIMQVHPLTRSAVTFQWRATNNCQRVQIGVMTNNNELIANDNWVDPNKHLRVIIYEKNWGNEESSKVFLTELPKTVKRLNSINWHNIAVVSTKALKEPLNIVAQCVNYDDYKNIYKVDNKILHLPFSYAFTGQGSIIRGSNQNNSQPYGVYKDIAIGSKSNKALTLFQWQSAPNCKRLMLKAGFYPNINDYGNDVNINDVKIKRWSEKNWNDVGCNNQLPCVIDAPDGGIGNYYIIKVKSNPSTFPDNILTATCIDR